MIYSHAASKELNDLRKNARVLVENALSGYAVTGYGDIKRLQDLDGFRMRVGQYRVIFDEDQATILAVYVGRRSTTTYGR